MRRSPIHEQLKQAGAFFGESAGWERPMWFAPDDVKAEYDYGYNKTAWFTHWKNEHNAIREDVGLVDLSSFCKILVEGRDTEKILQRICTNDVAVEPGRVVYTQWLIYLNNELVGIITTGTYGHTLGAPIGLGWVTLPMGVNHQQPESQHYTVLVAGKKIRTRASLKPLYDPHNKKRH